MCKKFNCLVCNGHDWDRCEVAWEINFHGTCCKFLEPAQWREKCFTCRNIEAVIRELNALVWREPWRLETGREQEVWEMDYAATEDGGQSSTEYVVLPDLGLGLTLTLPVPLPACHRVIRRRAQKEHRAESANLREEQWKRSKTIFYDMT